jgi:hypothetical protein
VVRNGFCLAACVLFVAAAAHADTLYLHDGRVLVGRVIEEGPTEVLFEVVHGSIRSQMRFDREKIKRIEKGELPEAENKAAKASKDRPERPGDLPETPQPPPIEQIDGTSYCLVPLEGEVGATLVADLLDASLADAEKRGVDVVILHLDSPGGLVYEIEALVDVLKDYQPRLRIVAYIDEALSAAAITSLAVEEIYMAPGSRIGAAVPYTFDEDLNLPQEVSEKFKSAFRAQARGYAEIGGHDPLLAVAMINPEVSLYLEIDEDGEPAILEGEGKDMICEEGEILTLTADEAKKIGLSRGTPKNLEELRDLLGFEAWTPAGSYGEDLAQYWEEVDEYLQTKRSDLKINLRESLYQAAQQHPTNFALMYDQETGLLYGRYRKTWQNQSRTCAIYLRKASRAIEEYISAVESVRENEYTRSVFKHLRELKELLESDARRIYGDRLNYSVRRVFVPGYLGGGSDEDDTEDHDDGQKDEDAEEDNDDDLFG